MRDKFVFSDSQDLTALDSTGEISDYYFDLEKDSDNVEVISDDQVFCWFHILLLSATNLAGTEGLIIQLRTSDSTGGTTPQYLGNIQLLQADILAAACPAEYSIGVLKSNLLRYLCVWYMAVNTALTTATGSLLVDAWIDDTPHYEKRIQKTPS